MNYDLNNISRGINLGHNPNCFIGALKAVFDYLGENGDFLVNRHTGFLYRNNDSRNHEEFFVSCFLLNDILNNLKEEDGIIFHLKRTEDVKEATEGVVKLLQDKIPVIVFVDTFFLEFFPKKQGHEVHILVVYEIDLQRNLVLFSSTLPYNGAISLEKLAVARNSRLSDEWVRNSWLEIYFPEEERLLTKHYVLSVIDSNINAMNKIRHSNDGQFYGISGMKKFRDDLKLWQGNLDSDNFSQVLNKIFSQLVFLVDQRKRYASSLNTMSQKINYDFSKAVKLYTKVAFNWEIFRNLCFKISHVLPLESNRVIERLNLLIKQEEEALAELVKLQGAL